jgi:hypothetical protein
MLGKTQVGHKGGAERATTIGLIGIAVVSVVGLVPSAVLFASEQQREHGQSGRQANTSAKSLRCVRLIEFLCVL